ncbi:hypothetical protein GCM10022378_19690 [Salinicoccus jeotgali]|uniref:non-specific protein-tyrosine kinase n=1 Tax=Salinicoccus jeotgali TaxID=381634 RepID=A0ABP7FAC1_9STAP
MFGKNKSRNYVSGPRELIVERQPKSPVSEQFRTVRTNIMYSNIDTEIKTVLVTSATPGAGKSTTAANLAVAYAQSGKRTVLIDADLRRPTTHYTFEVTNQRGMSTAIVQDVPVENIVKETEVENLDIITSGPIPPNPSELLSSNKMIHMLKTFSMHYDMVIIDSPPLLAVPGCTRRAVTAVSVWDRRQLPGRTVCGRRHGTSRAVPEQKKTVSSYVVPKLPPLQS